MRSLALKLTLAVLAISLPGIVLVALFAGRATSDSFGHFMFSQNQAPLVAELEAYYRARGRWDGVDAAVSPGGPGMGMGNGEMHGMMMGGGFAVADAAGRVVATGAGHPPGAQLSAAEVAGGTPLVVGGQRVGTLITGRDAFGPMSAAGLDFLARVNRALMLGALGAGGAALLLGGLLARALTRPLRELTTAAHEIAQGRLEQKVPVRSQDELGALAGAFNRMSADLARARDQRRQMTADIAHELRTPLSVILGHAEALRDGVLPPSPETLGLVHDEAQRLSRLVEDLRTLSLAEAGELALSRRPTRPSVIVESAAAAQAPRAQRQQIELRTEIEAGLPEVEVDPDRMAQVMGNLLDNALRHTPAGGRVVCRVTRRPSPDARHPAPVTFSVSDTGPGIAPEDLPHLFDRFYRADKARGRSPEQRGSGLGLAIAKSIVEAHGGRLRAESEPGAGAQFFIEIPASA